MTLAVDFYTEDENTASIRIGINDKQGRIDLKAHGLTPRLHLFMEDGSIFKNEPLIIDDVVKGFLTYKIPKRLSNTLVMYVVAVLEKKNKKYMSRTFLSISLIVVLNLL